MKKTVLSLFCLCLTCCLYAQQEAKGRFVFSDFGYNFTEVSKNGQYVVGTKMVDPNIAVIWTEEGGIVELSEGYKSTASDVSDDGVVLGKIAVTDYEWINPAGETELITGEVPAFYKDGEWHVLSCLEGFNITGGGTVGAVSNDGTMIVGSMNDIEGNLRPLLWRNSVCEVLDFGETSTARPNAISGDGSAQGGFANIGSVSGGRNAVMWIDGEFRPILENDIIVEGEIADISSNGKYAALQLTGNDAAIYDIENNKVIYLGKPSGTRSASPTGVSDDGIVVGRAKIKGTEYTGFIYMEKTGILTLADYLSRLNIEVPADIELEYPKSISADGSRIVVCGYSYTTAFCVWVIDIDEHLNEYYPPQSLVVAENGLSSLKLEWEAPKEDAGHTVMGYRIYRNGILLNTEELIETLSYEDNDLANGTYNYTVAAVWDEDKESRAIEGNKMNIGLISVPFRDSFDTASMDTQYWNPQYAKLSLWKTTNSGILPPCLTIQSPLNDSFSESIYSSYIDATGATDLYLAFNLAPAENSQPESQIFKVEVFDGTEWQVVETFNAVRPGYDLSFHYYKFDISDIAAGQITRIRFTASGDAASDVQVWDIDNVRVYENKDEIVLEKPLNLTANRDEETNTVTVAWSSATETANLSYINNSNYNDVIGNEGVAFTVANMFDEDALAPFDGYKLKNISVFLIHLAEWQTPVLNLVAYSGNEKVLEQPIPSFTAFSWNTFTIEEDVVIDSSKPFYYGVEVVSHDVYSRIFSLSGNIGDEIDGKSNIYSLDGGQTWISLWQEHSIARSFSLIADIAIERDREIPDGFMGYALYRDGQRLIGSNSLTANNVYIEINNSSTEFCYEVSAYYYLTQDYSENSDKACIEIDDVSIDEVREWDTSIQVYPNPVYNRLNIDGVFTQASLFDVNGKLINQTTNKEMNVESLPNGIYLLEIETLQGKVSKKIIKR